MWFAVAENPYAEDLNSSGGVAPTAEVVPEPTSTFWIAFGNPDFDESAFSKMVRLANAPSTVQVQDSVQFFFRSVSILREKIPQQHFSLSLHSKHDGDNILKTVDHHESNAAINHHLTLTQHIVIETFMVSDIINFKIDQANMVDFVKISESLMGHPLLDQLASQPTNTKVKERVQGSMFGKILSSINKLNPHGLPHLVDVCQTGAWNLRAHLRTLLMTAALLHSCHPDTQKSPIARVG